MVVSPAIPFDGIIRIRFYGYDLSLSRISGGKHPVAARQKVSAVKRDKGKMIYAKKRNLSRN